MAIVTGGDFAVSAGRVVDRPGFTVSRPSRFRCRRAVVLDGLPDEVVARAQWWEAHRGGTAARCPARLRHRGRRRRPEYDPLRCTLRQREAAKVAELEASGETASLTTVQRMRLRYQAEGFSAWWTAG